MAKDTKKLILETARKHFVRNGFAGTRTQEIADEAGVNKAMLHYHFKKKSDLYHEIVSQTLDFAIPRFAGALEGEGTFWEKVERFVDVYTLTLIEQPDIPSFLMFELSQQREKFVKEIKKRSQYFPAIQNFIFQMMNEMDKGRIKEIPPVHLFLNIVGMTVFPFIARPIFQTIFEFSDDNFSALMKERKGYILEFVKNALRPD